MGFVELDTAIKQKFSTWTACKIKWPGIPFQEPSVAYICVNVLDGQGTEATIGEMAQRRHAGVISIQIFDKENKPDGEVRIRQLADQLEPLFIKQNARQMISDFEYIDYSQPSLSAGQVVNAWRQRNLTVSYTRDEFK